MQEDLLVGLADGGAFVFEIIERGVLDRVVARADVRQVAHYVAIRAGTTGSLKADAVVHEV